jgi:toxin YoeB
VKLSRTARFEKDYRYWLEVDPRLADKIDDLIDAVRADPFKGKGKPEPLRHELRGYWSRRITHEHRLVYSVEKDLITFVQCRFHY